MVDSDRIRTNLNFLKDAYEASQSSDSIDEPIMFSKLAVIELAGWLEMTFDTIARRCLGETSVSSGSYDYLEMKIKKTHGFTYEEHFKPLLVVALGVCKTYQIESELEQDGSLNSFVSQLNTLNTMRKKAAHTFVDGTTATFDAPSTTLDTLSKVEPVIKRIATFIEA